MDLINLILKLIDIYSFLLFIRVLLSWFPIDPYNPLYQFLYNITEPILKPLRTIIRFGAVGIDFSPIIAMLIIQYILKPVIIKLFFLIYY
ncbi:MAG TPA: YggT family protein [bacterium]|mgnify:CR=1 FL=1|nr:YggT family protein [bacterium]HOL48512.1 YggT family protein [bacterium]HPQ20009.1 YggT family protein [bacterium]